MTDSKAALVAKVTNTANTVTTVYPVTCREVITTDTDPSSANNSADLAYAFSDTTRASSTSETNIGWAGGTGTYYTSANTTSEPKTASVCRNDPAPSTPTAPFFRTRGTRWLQSTSYRVSLNASTPARTQEGWFRTTNPGFIMGLGDSSSAGGAWCTTSSSAAKGLAVYIDTKGILTFSTYNSGTTAMIFSSASVMDGAWHHFVAVYDKGNKSLYLDGVLQQSQNGPSEDLTNMYWRVGCDSLSGWPVTPTPPGQFDGDLQYVATYARALSSTEVSRHYSAGR